MGVSKRPPLRELHLFCGAGGGVLGGMLLGHTTVCAVEIEPYPRKVLLQRQRDGILPKFPIWDEIRTFDGKPWKGRVDIVCGGFPCQDISIAGKGAGIKGENSGLWAEMARVVSEVRPKYVFVENSSELIRRGLGRVISDLSRMGYACKWCCLGGAETENICNRERLWLLAYDSNCKRQYAPSIQGFVLNSEESFRRQFERASSSFVSEKNYTQDLRDTSEVSDWVDRLKAVGNGQDPVVAALAFKTLSEGLT